MEIKPPSDKLRPDDFLTIIRLLWTGGGWKAALIWLFLFIRDEIERSWKKEDDDG